MTDFEKLANKLAEEMYPANILPLTDQDAAENMFQEIRAEAYASCLNEMVQPLLGALENLIDAIPKQTEDADWWEDDLIKAVNIATKAIASFEGGVKEKFELNPYDDEPGQ